jgi:2-polyprenyl-3-methyl-5-hydroxy-6-metoxy-1,4-benzoquinol methylase
MAPEFIGEEVGRPLIKTNVNALGKSVIREISGDIPLSRADRLRYLLRNACRNIAGIGRGPRSRAFRPDISCAATIAAGQSPGRLLTELFIEIELPRLSPPRELKVVEIGCGSGSMVYRLARLGYCGRYTGVDITDRFRRDHPRDFPFTVSYEVGDAHAFTPAGPVDLLISVSTLEHIPDDAALIRKLGSQFGPDALELHVVPSGASLAVYLWHGYRQYTPAALAAKFGPDIKIVRLGGLGSYILHFLFITVPDLIIRRSARRAAPGLYRALQLWALRVDVLLPICPTAYAAIRRHRCEQR